MLRRYGTVATGLLALAAATGVLLRFGLYLGMPGWALNYMAVRHAHSHLMYFGWVTLGLMALIWHFLPHLTGRPRPRLAGAQMAVSAVLAALSFPAFWSNGYGLTQIGDVSLPLGSMMAGLNGLGWAAFGVLYVVATRKLPARSLPVRLWDWGLGLMAATAGALGLAGMVVLNIASFTLQQVFLHLFLDLFSVGWFTLGLLGALWAALLPEGGWPAGLPAGGLAMALLPTFLLGMSPMTVMPVIVAVAATANLIAALLLARHLLALWRRWALLPWLVRFATVALAVHLLVSVALVWPGVWRWSAGTQLRIFWLHNFLLGWVSSGLLGLLLWRGRPREVGRGWPYPRVAFGVWSVGVGVLLAALVALGLAQFVPVPPLALLRIAAWSSLLPAGVALWGVIAVGQRAAEEV